MVHIHVPLKHLHSSCNHTWRCKIIKLIATDSTLRSTDTTFTRADTSISVTLQTCRIFWSTITCKTSTVTIQVIVVHSTRRTLSIDDVGSAVTLTSHGMTGRTDGSLWMTWASCFEGKMKRNSLQFGSKHNHKKRRCQYRPGGVGNWVANLPAITNYFFNQ